MGRLGLTGGLSGALYGALKDPDEEEEETRLGNAAKWGLGGAVVGGGLGYGADKLFGDDARAAAKELQLTQENPIEDVWIDSIDPADGRNVSSRYLIDHRTGEKFKLDSPEAQSLMKEFPDTTRIGDRNFLHPPGHQSGQEPPEPIDAYPDIEEKETSEDTGGFLNLLMDSYM